MPIRKLKAKRAFTLIEMIIAMSVSSIFLTVLFSLYFQIQSLTQSKREYAENTSSALASLSLLIQDINGMVFEPWNKQTFLLAMKESCDLGTCSRLEMTVASKKANSNLLASHIFRVSYFIDTYHDKPTLFRRQDSFFTANNSTENFAPAIPLLENIEEFSIDFSENASTWQENWDFAGKSNPQPPQVFRIRLSYKSLITDANGNDIKSFEFLIRPEIMALH